jgi:peptidoglycan glycosyltransferase
MTKQIRNLGMFLAVLYVALFLQVNRLTVFDAEDLQNKPGNNREIERDFDSPRGSVSTADGVVVARSVDTPPGGRFELQREFPEGPRYAHITGYYGFSVGSAGLERSYNDELAGRTGNFDLEDLGDLFVEREQVGDLTLTVRDDVQRAAEAALDGREGAVVAIDPRTGGILAMYSNPTFDPNQLSVHDTQAAALVNEALNTDPENPKLSRAYQERFSPGSTFKVITSVAGVERGGVNRDQPVYPQADSYTAPGAGAPIPNFGGSTCGGPLFVVLQQSCNSAFAQMGVEDVGVDGMTETAEGFGFNADLPFDLPAPEGREEQVRSVFPDIPDNSDAFLGLSAIGQFDVQATPLEMALVAAGVANDGRIMSPHVVAEVRDDQDEVVDTIEPEEWRAAMEPATADLMRDAMRSVVDEGSAVRLNDGLENFDVGGKTGTAEIGDTGRSNTWIIGFAGPRGEAPTVAIGVIVQSQEGVSEQTGGRVAAPVGAAVLAAALQDPAPQDSQGADQSGGG